MRRSLLLRLLTTSLVIAAAAMAATAWLTTRRATERIEDEASRTLEVDNLIHRRLTDYAWSHEEWDDVGELVTDLAQEHDRRIALTTSDGTMIADSAELLDHDAGPLMRVAAALVDAFNASDATGPASDGTTVTPDGTTGDDEADGDERGGLYLPTESAPVVGHAYVLIDGEGAPLLFEPVAEGPESEWADVLPPTVTAPSAHERQQRLAMARSIVQCFGRSGVDAEIVEAGSDRSPRVQLGSTIDEVAGRVMERCLRDLPTLFEPSERYLRVVDQLDETMADCPDAAADGETAGNGSAGESSGELGECSTNAMREVLGEYVAPSALLYLGSDETSPSTLATLGQPRTALMLVAVFALAVVATVLVGSRIVRPVRAITNAAKRMAAGNRSVRVNTSGRDELARLAATFNTMADSVQRTEQQHKAMVTDVAHELRNPLTTMRSQLEAAQDDVVATDGQLVDSLLEETVMLQHLVGDLQDLALAEAGRMEIHPELVHVDELAAQSIDPHRAHADSAGVTLTVDAAEPVAAMADPRRLRQAVGNLVSNALRHTPPGGRVTVRVGRGNGAGEVSIAVADTGEGIEPEHLAHLFDRFYRVDSSRSRDTGGTGLGLAIVRHLVEAHGGRITVASEVGAGSVFTIHLPTGAPDAPSRSSRHG